MKRFRLEFECILLIVYTLLFLLQVILFIRFFKKRILQNLFILLLQVLFLLVC